MNAGIYRLIFNHTLGRFIVVSELTKSRVKGSAQTSLTHTPLKTYILSALLSASPIAFADILTDTSVAGHQSQQVISTANGTPQVNIQAPNNKGLSHNTYTQFDVDRNGVILNNALDNSQTQQAGLITGNPNLTNGTARVILNEVNSNDPSQLQGYIEVAGDRADVIVANPSGISCSGCGFINAQNATLTTGTPEIANGNLMGYRVTQGQISIDSGGLNSLDNDYTHIISRSVAVNADIVGNDLKITVGANQVSADHQSITPIEGSGEAPQVSIDVSNLGGMYAGHIRLIGTEAGVGVRNAGDIGASIGAFTLSADGQLINTGRIVAETDLTLNTQGLTNSRVLHSEQNLNIQSTENITNTGTLDAEGELTLNAQGQLTNTQRISADDALKIQAQSISNSGKIDSQANIQVTSDAHIQHTGDILASESLEITAQTLTQTNTSALGAGLQANGSVGDVDYNLSITTQDQAKLSGNQVASGDIQITAQQIDLNQVNQEADNIDLKAQQITGTQSQQTAQNISLNANNIELNQADNISLNADNITLNNGQIIAQENLTLNAQAEVNNLNNSLGAKNTSITAETITNSGNITAQANVTLRATQGIYQTETGQMGAGITPEGNIQEDQTHHLTLTTQGDAQLSGTQVASGDININAENISLNQAAQQAQAINLAANQSITSDELIQTADQLTLSASGNRSLPPPHYFIIKWQVEVTTEQDYFSFVQ